MTCTACPTPCASCTNSTACITCSTNYYLLASSCLNTCPNGTLPLNSLCQTCSPTCATCSVTLLNCTSCPTNASLYLYNGSCQNASACPNGTYPNSSVLICASCSQNCTACSSATLCTACVTGYYL